MNRKKKTEKIRNRLLLIPLQPTEGNCYETRHRFLFAFLGILVIAFFGKCSMGKVNKGLAYCLQESASSGRQKDTLWKKMTL